MGCDVIFIFVYFGGKITKKKQDTDREIRNGERKSTFILKKPPKCGIKMQDLDGFLWFRLMSWSRVIRVNEKCLFLQKI
jgi:hypothetical protein